MRVHVIIDHPWDHSFNYAVLDAFCDGLRQGGHTADVLDLNKEKFNPVMSEAELALYSSGGYLDPMVKSCQERIMAADHLAFIFPIWWNVMPAPLKGWMDKVLLPGFAFTTDQVPAPLLTHIRGATVLTTTGTPDEYHRREYNNALVGVLCKGTLEFCGVSPVNWLNFGDTGFASRAEHAGWLKKVEQYARHLGVEFPPRAF